MDAAHVRLEFDKKKLADLVETLGRFPQALPGVISRALNRTAQSMRSHVSADAAHALGTTERLIKSRIHVSWASESKLRATVYIDEKGFSLYLFKPVQNRMGVETTRGFLASFPMPSSPRRGSRRAGSATRRTRTSRIRCPLILPATTSRWSRPASSIPASTSGPESPASRS